MPEQGKSTLTVNTPTHREITSRAKGEGKKIYNFVDEVWTAFKGQLRVAPEMIPIQPNNQLKSGENRETIALNSDIERNLVPRIVAVLRSGNADAIASIEADLRVMEGLLRTGGTHGRTIPPTPKPIRKTKRA